MGRRTPHLRRITIAALSTLVAFAAAEVGLRLFAPVRYGAPPTPLSAEARASLLYHRSEVPGLLYELVPSLYTTAHGSEVVTNRFGMRDAEPRTGADAPSVRIETVGDSFGFGVPVEVAYPDVLERRLNEGRDAAPFEVLNLGVSGYSAHDDALVIRHVAPGWDPDLVVLGYFFNDPQVEDPSPMRQEFLPVV